MARHERETGCLTKVARSWIWKTTGRIVEEALRWRAYLVSVVEDEGDEEVADVAVYCPECADREFGDRRRLDQRPGAGSNARN